MPKHSRVQIAWLDNLSAIEGIEIQHALSPLGEYYILGIGHVDGYCASNNTVYEFHGSYWHGDPKLFDPASTNTKLNKTFGQLYSETLLRDEAIRKSGYNLTVVWESEVDRKALLASSKRMRKDISLAWISNDDLPHIQAALELYQKVNNLSVSPKVNIIRCMAPDRIMSIARRVPPDTRQMGNIKALNSVASTPSPTEECKLFLDEVYDMVKDKDGNKSISSITIYKRYLDWRRQSGGNPMGRNNLYLELDILIGSRINMRYYGLESKGESLIPLIRENEEQEALQEFLGACCVYAPKGQGRSKEYRVQASVLRDKYSAWCEHRARRPLGVRLFGKGMRKLLPCEKDGYNYYLGIQLKADDIL